MRAGRTLQPPMRCAAQGSESWLAGHPGCKARPQWCGLDWLTLARALVRWTLSLTSCLRSFR
eukprot:9706864-Karenia_brevis.AAC.1